MSRLTSPSNEKRNDSVGYLAYPAESFEGFFKTLASKQAPQTKTFRRICNPEAVSSVDFSSTRFSVTCLQTMFCLCVWVTFAGVFSGFGNPLFFFASGLQIHVFTLLMFLFDTLAYPADSSEVF